MPYEFLPMPFAFGDLTPAMSEPNARWHHDVEHKKHLDAVNRLLEPHQDLAALSIEQLLGGIEAVPDAIRDAVREEGGAHANHQFMWKIIGGARDTRPDAQLAAALERCFGGFEEFIDALKTASLALPGEGWSFLSLTAPRAPELVIVTTAGNGNVLELRKPGILICDLWQHAYAADHHGDRAAWLDAYLKIVDWRVCSTRYDRLLRGRPAP